MTGCFVAVVGPSGAGKDTLIAAARDRFADDPRFVFVRRVVTRRDGGNEDHDFVEPALFPAAVKAGAFALSWGAHGLFYGIPETVRRDVAAGRVVVANLSRGAVETARGLFPRVAVAVVTAPEAVLAARLAGRARRATVRSPSGSSRRRPRSPAPTSPSSTMAGRSTRASPPSRGCWTASPLSRARRGRSACRGRR